MRLLCGSMLLGAAAGLALATGANAADLPMKAKAPAVQYVKVCSLYGAGYYYIPGTDTCLKIGGFVRVDAIYGPTAAPFESLDFNAIYNRGTKYWHDRARAYVTLDARTQTEYGTLRSYFLTGETQDDAGTSGGTATGTAYMIRAFVQLAGFTWGLSNSIFDTYAATPIHLNYVSATNGNIGATGIWQARYTAQFGNGWYLAAAIEDPYRRQQAIAFANHAGGRFPDGLISIGANAAWGRAAVTAAIADASSSSCLNCLTPVTHDALGWAVSAGALLKIPGLPGDNFGFQVAFAQGATGFTLGNLGATGGFGLFTTTKGGNDSFGFVTDGVVTPTGLDLTDSFSVEAGYEHAWTPNFKTAIAGGFGSVRYTDAAKATLCGVGCNPEFSVWNVGESTKWFPVANLQLGLDVFYTHINSGTTLSGLGPRGNPISDADIVTGLVRVQRVFWP